MKIRMLVGACGLALTGSAFAGGAMHEMKPYLNRALSAEDMAELRAMRAENPPRKQLRSLANGVTRGPSFVYRDEFNCSDGDQARPQDGPGMYICQIGLIDTADYTGDFSLIGQLEPDGNAWAADDSEWLGVVENSVAISNQDGDPSNGEYNGPVGGPDPMGVRGGMLNFQKASVGLYEPSDAGFGFQHADVGTDLYTSGAGEPLFFEIDIYKNKHEDFVWMNLISFTEGANVQAMYVGGSASGAFSNFAQRYGGSDVIEGPIVVADDPNDIDSAPFVDSPYQIPEGTWYTIGFLTDSANWQAMFLKDSQTQGDDDNDGIPNYVMPDNTVTGMRMFEEFGLGLEEGWVQILPGTMDDPMTDEIEGVGFGADIDGNPVPNPFTFGGNMVTSIFSGISIDFYRFFLGDDGDNPPNDYWLDDVRMRGVAFEQPDPIPTYRIPYIDDIERWNPGPMGLQGGRWGDISSARIFVTDSVNDTPPPGTGSGSPSQSIFYQNTLLNDVFLTNGFRTNLPTTPRVRAEAGDPAIISVATIQPNDFLSMTISPVDNTQAVADSVERWGRFLTAATDANQIPDGLAYVRQRKPIGTNPAMGEYDPTQPIAPLSGPNLTPAIEGVQNTEFINVIAAPSGQSDYDFPTGSFQTIEFQVEPGSGTPAPNGDEHILRVFVDGTELFPNGDPNENFTTNTLTADDLQFGSGNNNAAGFVEAFFDDIFFAGPTDPINQVDSMGNLVDAELSDDSPWTLPFADSLDTYDTGRPAPGQGFADHRLEFLPLVDPDVTPVPQDFETIEFLDTAQNLSAGDDVVLYEVVTIDQGAANVPFAESDLVAVPRANLLREYDPAAEVYGRLPSADPMNPVDPTAWYVLDAVNGTEIARGTWFLAVENNPGAGEPNGVTEFDPMSHVDAGFTWSWRKNARYTGTSTESSFVSAADEGVDTARGSRGDVGKFIVKNNTNAESENQVLRQNIGGTFGVFMPLAQTEQEGDTATLSFDFYVNQSDFETGMWTVFPGGTVDGGEITALGYGGKGFVSGNDVMGITPFLPNNGNFFVRIANPLGGSGNPEFIWQDTGVPVPTQQWFNVEMTVNNFSEWEILIDGATLATGVAGDAGDPNANTNSLDSMTLVRNQFGDNDGNPTDGDIVWQALAFDAPAPVGGDVPDEYHAYRIDEVLTGTAPQIWPVDQNTGTPDTDMMGMPVTREFMDGDFIVLENADPANGGAPYDQQFVNSRWRVQDSMGVEVASGTWDPIGLPGAAGQGGLQDIAGGIGNGNTPPYNEDAPFRTILLGNYVSVQASQVFPRDTWYFDNIMLDVSTTAPCPADLTGNGTVDAGDLAALISQWGQMGTSADFNGDGVGADDLASLISAWGACP